MRFRSTPAGLIAALAVLWLAGTVLAATATAAPSPATTATASAGSSWGEGVTLGSTGRETGAPEIAVAPGGEAVAAWVGSRPSAIEVSSRRPGKGWSPPVTVAAVREEVEGPQIAVSAGKVVIVWTDNIRTRSGTARVVLAATRLRGKRWSPPRNISAEKRWRSEPEGEEPQVTITRGGKAIVIWRACDEGHSSDSFIRSATQAASGMDWTAPRGIRGSYEGEGPQIAMTPAGEAVAVWGASYDEESSIDVSSRPRKGAWKGAGRLGYPGPFPAPELTITSKGEAIATWVKQPEDSFGATVQVATRPPGGKWKVKSLAPQDYGTAPEVVTEPGGRARVIWVQGVSFEKQTVVTSTHAPGGAWSEPVDVAAEGLQLSEVSESLISVTPAGESIAVWVSNGGVGQGTTIEASSRLGSQPWSEPTEVSTSPAGPLYGAPGLQLALAPSGEAFAVWQCFDGSGWVTKAATRPPASSS